MDYKIRLIEDEDAGFIVAIRNNPKLNRHLNPTSASLEDQLNWINTYKIKEKEQEEFYFIIFENGIKRGLYRLYKVNKVSFTIGSWLFDTCDNFELPIMTDLLMADFGFYTLNKPVLLFDIRKENRKVIQYHALKMPLLYTEDELNNYYLLQKDQWERSKDNVFTYFDINKNDYEAFMACLEC